VIGLAAVLVGVGLLAGCGGGSDSSDTSPDTSTTAAPVKGGTLRFARAQDAAVGLDPINAPDNGSIFTIKQIFEPLADIGDGPDPIPGLAESWTTSEDGKVWTFTLRDAKFSNGDPVTAEDAAFSIERFADPKINVAYPALSAAIEKVEVVGPKEIKITLNRVDGAFLDAISMFAASIVPKKVVQDLGEKKFAEAPVGSGPFMVTEFTRGQRIVLERNPFYWREGEPLLDEVIFEFTPDANTRVLKLRSGEVDVADSIPVSQVASLEADDGISVLVKDSFKWDAIWLNTTAAPLSDPKLRQALNYATPKEQILETVLAGNGEVANSTLPRVKYWDESVKAYPYDIEKAKALIAESTVPNGTKIELAIVAGDPQEKQMAEIFKAEWAKIGVDAQIVEKEFGDAFSSWLSGKGGDAISFPGDALSSDTLSDDSIATLVLDPKGGLNALGTGYDNPEVLRLLKEASGTLDEGVRAANFATVQQLALDDAPAVPLFFSVTITGLRDSVQGFTTYKTGWWNLRQVSLK
jgi:peptide/nickel transport system substrate-binding protein